MPDRAVRSTTFSVQRRTRANPRDESALASDQSADTRAPEDRTRNPVASDRIRRRPICRGRLSLSGPLPLRLHPIHPVVGPRLRRPHLRSRLGPRPRSLSTRWVDEKRDPQILSTAGWTRIAFRCYTPKLLNSYLAVR